MKKTYIILAVIVILLVMVSVRRHNSSVSNNQTSENIQATSTQNTKIGGSWGNRLNNFLFNKTDTPSSDSISNTNSPSNDGSDSDETTSNTLLCKAPFPFYLHRENPYSSIWFYEDANKTYIYTKHYDGTKSYLLADKNTFYKTRSYSIDSASGECYGYTSESFNPKYAQIFSPFTCQTDRTYGFCPLADYYGSLLLWDLDKIKDGSIVEGNISASDKEAYSLDKQYGRGFSHYLLPKDKSTALTDKNFYLVPTISEAPGLGDTIKIPVKTGSEEIFDYKVKEGDNILSIADDFAVSVEDIYNNNESLKNSYGLKSCYRVADKNSKYRGQCIDALTCRNVGVGMDSSVITSPFDLSIFNIPKNCTLD